jgi:hypothetical protein
LRASRVYGRPTNACRCFLASVYHPAAVQWPRDGHDTEVTPARRPLFSAPAPGSSSALAQRPFVSLATNALVRLPFGEALGTLTPPAPQSPADGHDTDTTRASPIYSAPPGRAPSPPCPTAPPARPLVGLAGTQVNVGYELAGQRVTLRIDGTQMAVISYDGELLRTLRCPVPLEDRHRLRGARRARPVPPQPGGPITAQRRVSCRGSLMIARQKIHVGMIHAGKTATVICEENHFEVVIDAETAAVVPRTTTSETYRYKANAAQYSLSGPAQEGR